MSDKKKDEGNTYQKRAGLPSTGNRTIDRREKEAQDQANKDRQEQQGKDKEI